MTREILLSNGVYSLYETLAPNQYLELFYDTETDELFSYIRDYNIDEGKSVNEGIPNIVRIGVLEPHAHWEYEDFVEGIRDILMDMNIECYDGNPNQDTVYIHGIGEVKIK